MKILFAHNNADLYGSSRSLLRLASRLVKDGYDVHVLLPFGGELDRALVEAGVVVHVIDNLAIIERSAFKSIGGLLFFMIRIPISVMRIRKLIKTIQPDIVHSNTSVMIASALAGRFSKVRNVWHIREFYTDFSGFWKMYERLMGFCADQVICVSHAVQEQFATPSVRKKTVVIHNGFPKSEFQPVAAERVAAFKQANGLDDFLLVGLIGRIILQRKGQDVFVRAAALLKSRYPDVRFVVIGSCYPGNEYHGEDLSRLIDDLDVGDVVTQTGKAEDIKAAYAALDISVLASAKPEPFGGVTIESMAYGKPVVGTNIGGTPEQIKDGETGLLITPNDSHAMADAIARLIDDEALRAQMGAVGRQLFESKFEFEPFYDRIIHLYKEL